MCTERAELVQEIDAALKLAWRGDISFLNEVEELSSTDPSRIAAAVAVSCFWHLTLKRSFFAACQIAR